jgi:hypothetical protein
MVREKITMYNHTTENWKAQHFITNLSRNFKPEDAVLVNELKESPQHASGEHYTFSAYIPQDFREKLEPISKKLTELDPSLILNEPDLFHLTVFWCSLENPIEKIIGAAEEVLKKEKLSFDLRGLISAPFGISIKAYPRNEIFMRLREKLSGLTGTDLPQNPDGSLHEKAVSTWITLGRYTEPPQAPLLEYINSRVEEDFGIYTPESITLYKCDNKYLRNPQVIKKVPIHGNDKLTIN